MEILTGFWLHLHPPTTATTNLSESFTNPNLEIESLTGYVPSTSTPTSNNNQNYSYGQQNKPYYFDSQIIGNLGGGGGGNGNTTFFTHVHQLDKVISESLIRKAWNHTISLVFLWQEFVTKKSSPSVVIRKPDGSDIITMSGAPAPPEMSAGEWEDQGRRKEQDGNFGWTEKVLTGSSTSKDSSVEETPLADGWTAACGEVSGVSVGKTVESLPGECDINSLGAKFASLTEENARTSTNMRRHSLFSSSDFFPEISEPPVRVEPYTISATKPWSQLSANNSSFNQSFSSLDDPKFYPSTPNKSIKSANVNPIERAGNTCFNSDDLRDYTPSSTYRKDPLIQLSVDRQESIADASNVKDEMDRSNQILMKSSTLQKNIISKGSPILQNSWNQFFRGEQKTNSISMMLQLLNLLSSDTFDRLNPPVDSPCWKGAPAFRSFPFTGKEVQDPHIFPINDGDDTTSLSKPENGNPIPKEHEQEANGNISSSLQGLPLKVRAGTVFCFLMGPKTATKKVSWQVKQRRKCWSMINAMHNLSELLQATCSGSTLEEQDHEILQHITSNLSVCALMKPGTMRSGPGLNFPQSMSSCSDKSLPDPHKGVVDGISQVTTKESCAHQNQCENQTVGKGWQSSTMCEDLSIKKHLKESRDDFYDEDGGGGGDDEEEEVSLSRVQLYKNLWLEAEAAMCSMKYNARCASMKIEEYRQQQEKVQRFLGDQNSFEALSPTTKHKLSATPTQETSQTNTNNQVEDVEASVMARLHLLKCGVDNSSSMSVNSKTHSQGSNLLKETNLKKYTNDVANTETAKRTYIPDRLSGALQSPLSSHTYLTNLVNEYPLEVKKPSSSEWEHVLKDELTWQN
ncbi:hypothetical protein MKX03_022491 [Papaver bracteatum]|nr:hypothetical protein MKX03_022491 [Papaver bracteatum]